MTQIKLSTGTTLNLTDAEMDELAELLPFIIADLKDTPLGTA